MSGSDKRTVNFAQAVVLASGLLLTSCGDAPPPDATHWRIAVSGSPSCLGDLTREMAAARIEVARFPEWKDGDGVMEFGPISKDRIEDLNAIVRASGCAAVTGKRPSCSTDHSDIRVC
ncbi:hypothetical protein [Sphingopyxis sp.]|uniref:hypothetical protein n=1 Tax=Sphingopyxis sp. TaxID=1908224 RepID=UPI003D0F8047